MSVQMDQKIDKRLVESIQKFLKLQATARANETPNETGPDPDILNVFRQSFQNGGLDEIDLLIVAINDAIKLGGGKEGLGEGAALQHADGDHPAYLHISFIDFRTEKIITRESIALDPPLPA